MPGRVQAADRISESGLTGAMREQGVQAALAWRELSCRCSAVRCACWSVRPGWITSLLRREPTGRKCLGQSFQLHHQARISTTTVRLACKAWRRAWVTL